jgi:hypothetical protein
VSYLSGHISPLIHEGDKFMINRIDPFSQGRQTRLPGSGLLRVALVLRDAMMFTS